MTRHSARQIVAELQNQGAQSLGHALSGDQALSDEQREWLRRCAEGISLRFEATEIVEPLIRGGYASRRLAGVVVVTGKGREYLQRQGK